MKLVIIGFSLTGSGMPAARPAAMHLSSRLVAVGLALAVECAVHERSEGARKGRVVHRAAEYESVSLLGLVKELVHDVVHEASAARFLAVRTTSDACTASKTS